MRDNPSERLPFIDLLRGLAVINMVLYHAVWDAEYLVGIDIPLFPSLLATVWQRAICITFITLSGFCWAYSRHPLKNGAIAFGAGALVTLATFVASPSYPVIFGVLTFLGSCMLLLLPLRKWLLRLPAWIGAVCALALLLLFYPVKKGYLLGGIALPEALYCGYVGAFFGFMPSGFSSADYFPLLPWSFLFILGAFLAKAVRERESTPRFLRIEAAPLELVGKHSLLIYLLHQPILSATAALINTVI